MSMRVSLMSVEYKCIAWETDPLLFPSNVHAISFTVGELVAEIPPPYINTTPYSSTKGIISIAHHHTQTHTPIGKKGMIKTSPVSHLIHKVIDLDGLLHASTLNRPTMASGRSISLPFTVRRQGKRGNTYTLHRPSSYFQTHTPIGKQHIPQHNTTHVMSVNENV
jgi:hypothetical protein